MRTQTPPLKTRRSPRTTSPAESSKAKTTPPQSPKVTNPLRRKSPLTNKATQKNPAVNISVRRRSNSLPTKSTEKQVTVSSSGQPPLSLAIIDPVGLGDSPQSPMSPIYKPFPPFHTQEEEKVQSKQRANKGNCPCRASSEGQEWVLKCCRCLQHWHASCSNLKGANQIEQQTGLDAILQHWECPWCYTCIFPRPKTHPSAKKEKVLAEETIICSTAVQLNESALLENSLLQKITESVKETIERSIPSVDITSLNARLEDLNSEIQEFKGRKNASPQHNYRQQPKAVNPSASPTKRNLKCPEKPYEQYKDLYLTNEELSSVGDLLGYLKDSGDFIEENGHSVRLYGESYRYTGSQPPKEHQPIPSELVSIIDRFSTELQLEHKPNSVLINHYPSSDRLSPSQSYLAMHSDDESTILANSKIVTISIGATRTVLFEPKQDRDQDPTELDVKSNSLYTMTRSSQNWYRHGVPKVSDESPTEERFSITFRSLSSQSRRNIVLIGDSNTKDVNFGDGIGKVGHSFPGKRVKAARVKDINPHLCAGYSNAFLMCGTNDLRSENVRNVSDIHKTVSTLKNKLTEIRQLCPLTNIFVVPVLPSRIHEMNKNIMLYNNLVHEMIDNCFPDIWFKGIYGFLDNNNLLSVKFTRGNDMIHLGSRGLAKFVSHMKNCVFLKEKILREKVSRESAQRVGSTGPT